MSTTEKLLDALIRLGGEKLVIGDAEPPYLTKDGKKKPLIKKTLGSKELEIIGSECDRLFQGQPTTTHGGKTVSMSKLGTATHFSVVQNGAAATTAIPVASVPTTSKPQSSASPATASAATPRPVGSGGKIDVLGLLRQLVAQNGSDLHLSSNCPPCMRIDGDLEILNNLPVMAEDQLWNGLVEIMTRDSIEQFEATNDTDCAYEIPGVARFRVNVFRDHRGIGAVMRQIPQDILPLEVLNVPKEFVTLCSIPKGLILVTGPTGSGKSTTLASLIDNINETQKKHIITIEDPVEFVHPNKLSLVNQREIGTHTNSFKISLKAALREDPDVILVGEMRDLETIAIAIEMAVTGHLVFGTLHTSSAIATVDRIVDQFPADQQSQIRMMCSDALLGVLSQCLCKKEGGGRVAAYEVLIANASISNLIREAKTYQIQSIMQTGKKHGQRLMNDSLCELVANKIVTADEAMDKAVDKEGLLRLLQQKRLVKGAPAPNALTGV